MKAIRHSTARYEETQHSFSPWWEYRSRLVSAAESVMLETSVCDDQREGVAQRICAELVRALWDRLTEKDRRWFTPWECQPLPLPLGTRRLAQQAAAALEHFSEIEASYLVGTLYTALLPAALRAERGAYYTPPALAERLLHLAAAEGCDWAQIAALDPACGGGAFLAPLANRILNDHRMRGLSASDQLTELERRLAGIEIDPFAAWLARTFLQLLAYPVSRAADRPLAVPVTQADALELVSEDRRTFDLIIGNPPYGRVGLNSAQRRLFARSLYGHANLYGVFLDAALRWRRPNGLVAFLTPTSFLGGQYFSKLRELLLIEAPPLVVDVVEARKGVFQSVLQETCLTVFGPNPSGTTVMHLLRVNDRSVQTSRAGVYSLKKKNGEPWLLPRSTRQAQLIQRSEVLKTRLHHLGYKASTGPLVWNRHKDQLRRNSSSKTYPLLWAEAVRPNEFSFDYRSRAAYPFVSVGENQGFLICREPCVLVQRTTAKEQQRRLIACAVPRDFLERWGGVVVENHVNVLRAVGRREVAPEVLAAVLNTDAVDQLFRCLSGSVAVSATELHALPLPDMEIFHTVATVLERDGDAEKAHLEIEEIVARAFGE